MEWNRNVLFSQSRAPRGSFTFDGTYTGSALADFMLGYVKSDNVNPTHTNTDLTDNTQAYYVNDDWKTTDRLTINLGLRWDYYAPYTQRDDRFADIYQNGFLITNVFTPANSPYGRGLLQRNLKDFGPRFGFAYRPRFAGETVVRGGYASTTRPKFPTRSSLWLRALRPRPAQAS
jgi:outer membrane receptor protein involved in Fe transport